MGTRTDLHPAPEGAAQKIRAAAALGDRVRQGAEKLADDFRRADRFFKMRLGIVAAWAILAAATLWGACPSAGPTNALGADVQVLRESFVGGQQLLVRNESSDLWTDVVLTLDDGWRYAHKTMRPHDQIVLSMSQFRRGEEAAPRDYKPRLLRIECEQGSHSFDLR